MPPNLVTGVVALGRPSIPQWDSLALKSTQATATHWVGFAFISNAVGYAFTKSDNNRWSSSTTTEGGFSYRGHYYTWRLSFIYYAAIRVPNRLNPIRF